MNTEKFYTVYYECQNCLRVYQVTIERGRLVPDVWNYQCPICGCEQPGGAVKVRPPKEEQ